MGKPSPSSRPLIFGEDVRTLKAHSDWLGAEDIGEARPTLTIKRVLLYKELRVNSGLKRNALVLQFEEIAKGLILNATNRKTITRVLGTPKAKLWPGQKITLYSPKVKAPPGSETAYVWGVRVLEHEAVIDPAPEESRLPDPAAVF